MNTEKFTPGEWRAEITRVYLSDGRMMWIEGKNFETQEANASLIAAAPEMYEFVKMFTSTAGQFLLSHADNGKEIYSEAMRILRKARGEE